MNKHLAQLELIQAQLNKLRDMILADATNHSGDDGDLVSYVTAALNSDHPLVMHMDLFDTTFLFMVCSELYPECSYFQSAVNMRKFHYILRKLPNVTTFRLSGYIDGRVNPTLWCVRNRDRYDKLSRDELYQRYKVQQEMGSAEYRKRKLETMSTSFL